MRILMVAHSFPRMEGDVAGAFLGRLAEALIDRGHELRVIAPADRGDCGAPMLGRIAVRRVRYATPARETLAYRGTMHADTARSPLAALAFASLVRATSRAIAEECAGGGVHLVHAHWWVPGGLSAVLANRHSRPLVVTLHGSDVRLAHRVPGARLAMGAVLRRAALVTAVSSFLADRAALAAGIPRAKIPVTPMPLAGIGPVTPAIGVTSGVVFVGRLTKQKGVTYLLEALALLRKQGLPLDLTIVGDGPERVALKAQARALAVPSVFTGFVEPELVADHLAAKRVLVLPSIEEGLGLVVAEALAQGVPVVATRSGGIPDLLTEDSAGELVPPADVPALAAAIKKVVTDDSYLTGAVNAGRALLARLSPAASAAAFEAVYAEARGRRVSGSQGRRVSGSQGQRVSGAQAQRPED